MASARHHDDELEAQRSMALNGRRPQGYSSGELFCGAGGLSRGFHDVGFSPKFANDIWAPAVNTFMMNFDRGYAASGGVRPTEVVPLLGSVENLDAVEVLASIPQTDTEEPLRRGDLDVLLGGPPCQGYSLNSHTRSAGDPRNYLFRHYVRFLRELAPKVFVLENVPGMLSLEDGHFFDELLSEIGTSVSPVCPGYEIEFKILNAAHYGVPQERFRIVVIGTRRDVAASAGRVGIPNPVHYSYAQAHFRGGRTHTFHYAIGHSARNTGDALQIGRECLLPPISVQNAIGDLPPLVNGGGIEVRKYSAEPQARRPTSAFQKAMRKGARQLSNHWCRELMPPNTERVKHIPVGGNWRSIPHELLPPGMQRALRKDHTTRYGRLDPNGLAGTLLTKPDPHWGTFLHYDATQQRLISVREAARFQSFPDTHVFYGSQGDQYRLCGNAVPPLMAQAIGREVLKVIDRYYGRTAEDPKGIFNDFHAVA